MSAVLKAFKAPKVTPKKAVVGKTGANSGKSTIFGGPIAPSAVIIAPEEIDTIESILPCSIIPGQSIALKMIGRMSNFRPPIIVDLPEMKGLLATSTPFPHDKRRTQLLNLTRCPFDCRPSAHEALNQTQIQSIQSPPERKGTIYKQLATPDATETTN